MPSKNTPAELAGLIAAGAKLFDLIATGATQTDIVTAIYSSAQTANLASQSSLPVPLTQSKSDWSARKSWLMDGQMIDGSVTSIFPLIFAALQSDDQLAYSRKLDVAFKIMRTLLGDPPQ